MTDNTFRKITAGHLCRALYSRFGEPKYLVFGITTMLYQSPYPVSMASLIDWIYGEDEDGGPLHAKESVREAIWRLRKEGFRISKRYGGRGAGYTLEVF